jgi:DNA invertase Pin-like site-specific DNA recombinase
MNLKLTIERLSRRALVYVRQSTPGQVIHRQESQRLQYGLVDRARGLGFHEVGVIDDDLGRTASGLVDRPGFQRLVAEVCTGDIGAVFCIEASRLARNGRDWHHLIELCGMVSAVVVDFDGVYDPNIVNDRLLLGLKGTMSEFELNLFRQRSHEAIRQKAGRGELRFILPAGFYWNSSGKIEKDPDQRVQQAIQLVFSKMLELGSVRQTLLWFRQENVHLPVWSRDPSGAPIIWRLPSYHNLLYVLTNPIYAGAYAFGKRETRTKVVDGRIRKAGHQKKSRSAWTVLIRDHHPGYVSWEEYERYQAMLAANAYMKSDGSVKSGRGGGALLSGLLRCRRCGRMIHLNYAGPAPYKVPRYDCSDANRHHAESRCISFGGLAVDEAVAKEVLGAIEGNAIEAALAAAEQVEAQKRERRKSIELELEQARYEARLAARRYEAVDPDQRLVAAELEARWNSALERTREVEGKLQEFDSGVNKAALPSKELLLSLAQDLPAAWNAASTDMRLKQRIVRILIKEIMADVDEDKREVVLLIHWAGGRHSELRVKKRGSGHNRWCTSVEAVEVIRQMAGNFTDEVIAGSLNRLGLRTGTGYTWDKQRVYGFRQDHQLPTFDPSAPQTTVTMKEAARHLKVTPNIIRRMITEKILPASQVVATAPWEIPAQALDSELVRRRLGATMRYRAARPRRFMADGQQSMFSDS